jgi:hypothetical protein
MMIVFVYWSNLFRGLKTIFEFDQLLNPLSVCNTKALIEFVKLFLAGAKVAIFNQYSKWLIDQH